MGIHLINSYTHRIASWKFMGYKMDRTDGLDQYKDALKGPFLIDRKILEINSWAGEYGLNKATDRKDCIFTYYVERLIPRTTLHS